MNRLQRPWHRKVRRLLRVGGPILLLLGVALLIVGGVSFFGAFGGGGSPRYFWCCFAGMPLVFLGAMMCQIGYVGALARYLAAEQTPVATDAINDLVDGTEGSIRKVSKAVAQGIDDARRSR